MSKSVAASKSNSPKRSRKPSAKTGKKQAKNDTQTFANYHAAVKYVLEHTDLERVRANRVDASVFKLDRMRAILKKLDNPQEGLCMVHVAGTNGKGSTVAMVESALRECGYTVGTFTSPHLIDMRERIRINGEMIGRPRFAEVMSRVADAAAEVPKKHGAPTFFELLTAAGLTYLCDQAVDVALIEAGLGGRLDSTNVITPAVSAVTGISLDHTQFLGTTVEAIAAEKAGIFKKDVSALTIKQDAGILDAMRGVAEEVGGTVRGDWEGY